MNSDLHIGILPGLDLTQHESHRNSLQAKQLEFPGEDDIDRRLHILSQSVSIKYHLY